MTSPAPSTDASRGADAARPVFLSNGTYTCFFTPAGTGFSSVGDCQLTSWRDDPCEDDLGFYIYVRDRRSGAVTTACGAALAGQERGRWEVEATAAVLHRTHAGVESTLRLEVLEDRPVERRRLRLRNAGREPRELELTSYVEVVLNDPAAHAGHPGFSKLFVETAWNPDTGQLRATRRPRANSERHPTLALTLRGAPILEWESDRSQFLGRGRSPADPRALESAAPLAGRVGAVLDPVLALRTHVRLAPGQELDLCFILAVSDDPTLLDGHVEAAAGTGTAVAAARPPAADSPGPSATVTRVEAYLGATRGRPPPRTTPARATRVA